MERTEFSTETSSRSTHTPKAMKQQSPSVSNLLNYVEPEIAEILDKSGAKVHIMRAELFTNIETFLDHLDIEHGDKIILVTSAHDASVVPLISKPVMTKGATVRTYISHKLQPSTFVLGIVKRTSF